MQAAQKKFICRGNGLETNGTTQEGKKMKRGERKRSKEGRERRENLTWLLNGFLFLMLLLLASVGYSYILLVNTPV